MVFLTCLILTEFLPFSYTAPKLGHVLFEPLSYEAAMYVPKSASLSTTNGASRKVLRTQDIIYDTAKKPCLGYDYDVKLCKFLNDRIICGYNKNMGQPKNPELLTDIGNGCFIRGDRVECGYVTGPYTNSRRPGLNQIDETYGKLKGTMKTVAQSTTKPTPRATPQATKLLKIITTRKSIMPKTPTTSPTTITSSTTKPTTTKTLLTSTKPTTTLTTEFNPREKLKRFTTGNTTKKPKLMCVDKDNSIFCYEVKEAKYLIY